MPQRLRESITNETYRGLLIVVVIDEYFRTSTRTLRAMSLLSFVRP
jgi:hypothetical protein